MIFHNDYQCWRLRHRVCFSILCFVPSPVVGDDIVPTWFSPSNTRLSLPPFKKIDWRFLFSVLVELCLTPCCCLQNHWNSFGVEQLKFLPLCVYFFPTPYTFCKILSGNSGISSTFQLWHFRANPTWSESFLLWKSFFFFISFTIFLSFH